MFDERNLARLRDPLARLAGEGVFIGTDTQYYTRAPLSPTIDLFPNS